MSDESSRREAREIAEGAREGARSQPSLAASIFLGRLEPELVWPFPEEDPAERRRTDAFLAELEAVLRDRVDPDRVDREAEVPAAALEALERLGAFRMKLPPEWGGLGFGQRSYDRAIGLVGSWCGSTAIWLAGHQSIGVGTPLLLFGTEAQKAKYLPRLAAGALSAFALTEPEVGSDPARMRMTATPTPDGEAFVLEGEKLWCTNGPVADLMIVMARTPDRVVDGRPRKQISAFLVETSWPGVETLHRCDFMGYRGIQNGWLRFHGVRVPRENILWGEGMGLKLAFVTLNTGRLTLPCTNTAVARQCCGIARRWAAERHQWGAPIGRHEAIAVKLGWIASHTFAMESISTYASALADRGDTDLRLEAAIAKLFCSETGFGVVDRTLQIRGGRGYETEASLHARGETPWPVERLFREARLNTIVEGSSEILRLFLAREAMDPHVRRAGALLEPDAGLIGKGWAALRAVLFYVPWYLRRWIPSFGVPSDCPAALRPAWRRTRRGARRLARRVFYAMARHGPGLEHRQALLGRLVDEGVDLTVSAATISRAASRGDPASIELARLFCDHARADRRRPTRAPAARSRGKDGGPGRSRGPLRGGSRARRDPVRVRAGDSGLSGGGAAAGSGAPARTDRRAGRRGSGRRRPGPGPRGPRRATGARPARPHA